MENIYVKMHGRLGNQLFRYATARCVQLKYGGQIHINFERVSKEAMGKLEEKGFENSLRFFNVAEINEDTNTVSNKGNLAQKILYTLSMLIINTVGAHTKLFDHVNSINSSNGLYLTIKGPRYCPIKKPKYRNCFLKGRFEDTKYFDEIRDQLILDIQPIYDKRPENKELYDVIEKHNSVCVSVRRGDYISNERNAKVFNVCDKAYWDSAIKYMDAHIKDAVYIIFSDDIEWCKNHMECLQGRDCYFETGNDPVWEKLRLMYLCKHFIISNSTFSWWAQYLSRNEQKIVISPDKWFLNSTSDYPLLLDSFVRIKPEQESNMLA